MTFRYLNEIRLRDDFRYVKKIRSGDVFSDTSTKFNLEPYFR